MLLYCNQRNATYLLLPCIYICGNVYQVVVLGHKVYMLIITLWLSSWVHAYLLLLWSLNVRFHISSVWLHISQLLYFHNRARWAIKVTICPHKQPPLYGHNYYVYCQGSGLKFNLMACQQKKWHWTMKWRSKLVQQRPGISYLCRRSQFRKHQNCRHWWNIQGFRLIQHFWFEPNKRSWGKWLLYID